MLLYTTSTSAPHKKTKKRDTFEEWLYRKKGEDTSDEFRRYSTAGSAIPVTERFNPVESARYSRSLPYSTTLGFRYIRLYSNILRMRASL